MDRQRRIRQLNTIIKATQLLRANLREQFVEILRLEGEANERLRSAQSERNRLAEEEYQENRNAP